jgi:hypothetical protein
MLRFFYPNANKNHDIKRANWSFEILL